MDINREDGRTFPNLRYLCGSAWHLHGSARHFYGSDQHMHGNAMRLLLDKTAAQAGRACCRRTETAIVMIMIQGGRKRCRMKNWY
jgi:hypothetical protein